jgi:hypothetical protein
MTRQEFNDSAFFGGMQGKVNGEWYPLVSCDFEDYTITIQDENFSVIPCIAIEELESPNA